MTNDWSVAPRERVNFEYRAFREGPTEHRELPLKILVVADLSQRADATSLAERRPFSLDKDTFAQRMAERALTLDLTVPDRLSETDGAAVTLPLRFASLKDFTPEGIARQVPAAREMLEMRSALCAFKGPLGGIPSIRKRITALLADETSREGLAREIEATRRPGADATATGPALVDLLAEAHVKPAGDGFDTLRRGLSAYLEALMSPRFAGEPVSRLFIDAQINELDARLAAQVDAALHHPALRRLEAAWRSLKHLVDAIDFRENIAVDALDCSKEDLAIDFEDAPDTSHSGLYDVLHGPARRGFDNEPYGLIVADYEFGPAPRDVWLLSRCAAVAEASHAPFIAAAAPSMAGASTWAAMPHRDALSAALDGADHGAWRSFRTRGEARYAGLCLPRFVLRPPYGPDTAPVKAFKYQEDVNGRDDRLLWGSAAIALATRVAESFARYRACANLIGRRDGALLDLVVCRYEANGEVVTRRPFEAEVSERDAARLADAGLIAVPNRGEGDAFFASAPSCHLAESEPGADPEALGRRLLSQLPYLLVITRVAHYLMAVHGPDSAPRPDERGARERLEAWLRGYTAAIDDPSPGVRARRPFREASITVEAVHAPTPGYHFKLDVRPHFTFEGAPFTLSLAGRLAP